jgi:hypothetical protein
MATLGGELSLLNGSDSETYEITDERAGQLAEMIGRPTNYIHRFVEQLSFVPTGGLRWERDLQIQLPAASGSHSRWWVLSLGPFNRRRFPDIRAINAAGEPLNLLTRKAHGIALAKATFATQIFDLPQSVRNFLDESDPKRKLRTLRDQLAAYFTETVDEPIEIAKVPLDPQSPPSDAETHPRIVSAHTILHAYKQLIEGVSATQEDEDTTKAQLVSFADVLQQAIDTTYYLCWVNGRPGEIIKIQVFHTNVDPRRSLTRKTVVSALRAMWFGFFGTKKLNRLKETADWYRRFGLAPINYEFNVPTSRYTASYYSTIAPPSRTDLTYLDWELSNSLEEREKEYSEVSSSSPGVHIHNAEPESSDASPTIRAYLRCTPFHHKQILGAAALNFVFVLLLAKGKLPGRPGDPLQGLLLAAPSALIAFLAQQQRHYYEHALRPSRGILWGYLVTGGAFLVAVAFNGEKVGADRWLTDAAWVLAIASVAIFVWYFPLGHMYERLVGLLFDHQKRKHTLMPAESWKCYEVAYEQCARWIWRLVVIASLASLVLLTQIWNPSKAKPHSEQSKTIFVRAESPLRIARDPILQPGPG